MIANPSRQLFALGDIAATAFAGALVAGLGSLAIPPQWPPLGGMIAGMLAGMVLAVPCTLLASRALGMIELMLQMMYGCMIAGMAGGMQAIGHPSAGTGQAAAAGALCGFVTSLVFAGADWAIRKRGSE